MTTSFQHSLSQLNQRMVDQLWHQWSSIGVAGYAHPDDKRIIDPEALILATTRYGRYDSRLMDESIDWLMKFGNRISVQRLQGLHKNWPGVADTRARAAIAEVLAGNVAHRKWRVLMEEANPTSKPEAFFTSIDGKPAKGVIVVFDPASPDKPRGVASTDQDGVYKLRRLGPGSKPGVPTGMYSVKLMPDVDSPGASRIPEKFSQSSQLSRDVTGPSPHSYDIEISTR
jgi:hypothetical protein